MDDRRYMLDTNTVSYIIKGHPPEIRHSLQRVPMGNICVSAITEAELHHGVARKPEAKRLPIVVKEFLARVDILPWDSTAAKAYAVLRVACEKSGKGLSAMDLLIAAHSVAVNATLVTSDKAFYQMKDHLSLEDWTRPIEH